MELWVNPRQKSSTCFVIDCQKWKSNSSEQDCPLLYSEPRMNAFEGREENGAHWEWKIWLASQSSFPLGDSTVFCLGICHQFDLCKEEFQDSSVLRYRLPLTNVPPNCDGCGDPFDLEHALKCQVGGLIILRHNEVKYALGDIMSFVSKRVDDEPVIREAEDDQ
eukprot:Selendium_serpulae@DN6283_c3_g5_i1.p1